MIIITVWLLITEFLSSVISQRTIPEVIQALGKIKVDVKHPSCMNSWIESANNRSKDIQQYFQVLLGSEIEQEFQQRGCRHIVAVTGDEHFYNPWLAHFPHYADVLFRFFSLFVWQRRFYEHNCLQKLMLNESMTLLWNVLDQEHTWIHRITSYLNQVIGDNVLISESFPSELVPKLHLIRLGLTDFNFIHASDALLMSNLLLNRPLCYYYGEKEKILQNNLRIAIVTRPTRSILNTEDIVKYLFHRRFFSSHQVKVEVMSFDGKSFEDQLKDASETDIMIGIHGAAFTNSVFMKPCSVLIEVYPSLFHGWFFFDRFTKGSDVIHYPWMESLENTIHPSFNSHSKCSKILRSYAKEYYDRLLYRDHTTSRRWKLRHNILGKNSSYLNNDLIIDDFKQYNSLSFKYMTNYECSECVKFPIGVTITIPKLFDIIQQALKVRKQCIMNHPYYNGDQ